MIYPDCNNKTQAVWWQDFPPKDDQSPATVRRLQTMAVLASSSLWETALHLHGRAQLRCMERTAPAPAPARPLLAPVRSRSLSRTCCNTCGRCRSYPRWRGRWRTLSRRTTSLLRAGGWRARYRGATSVRHAAGGGRRAAVVRKKQCHAHDEGPCLHKHQRVVGLNPHPAQLPHSTPPRPLAQFPQAGDRLHSWGHLRLRACLGKEEFPAAFAGAPLVAQFSSLGSLDAKWLEGEFRASLSAGRAPGGAGCGRMSEERCWCCLE